MARGPAARRGAPAGRFRAQRHLPGAGRQRPRRVVRRLILTASGGPFRAWSAGRDGGARRPAQAVAPSELVDGRQDLRRLRHHDEQGAGADRGASPVRRCPRAAIEVVVHPQSIVHSLVAFADGSVLAQLGAPDMRMPIAYALGWPARLATTAPAARPVRAIGGLDVRAARPRALSGAAAGPARLAAGRGGTYRAERRERGRGGGVPGRPASASSTSPRTVEAGAGAAAGAAAAMISTTLLAYDAEARRLAAEILPATAGAPIS